ncbi:peptidoglycan -binding protein [Dongia deserti]|uniref:peptidoglycan -binding protein n=1 Tax=Dongia deserti TaxID=2268030 RepID=UPI000E652F6D|nr:peptidoglycan -binding protein [Dongia deserti]
MALSRSRHRGVEAWPGYVDVLSTLLMVIVFVLMIFVIGQLFLSQALSGRDEALARLNRQIAELSDILSMREQETGALKTQVDQLSGALTKSTAERDELRNQLVVVIGERDTLQAQVGDLQRQLKSSQEQTAAQQALTAEAQKKLEEAYKAIEADREKINALLTDVAALESLRDELMKKIGTYETEKEELTAEAQKRVELLNQQILALRQQIAALSEALDIAETKARDQGVQIAELGRRLNTALASKVQELARYRSEFFGRLREILGSREDIQIVGDRFVFQSEVFFESGSAEIGPEGRDKLDALATTLILLLPEIPKDIDWVLRIDGHTDDRPIRSAQFPSNWELSTARAVSVVKYLASRGIPTDRLAAAGFAQFSPIDTSNTEEGRRRNRRIEIKLDQR